LGSFFLSGKDPSIIDASLLFLPTMLTQLVQYLAMSRYVMQKTFEKAKEFQLVLVSMMDLIVRKLFADDGASPSQLICLVYAGEMGLSNLLELPRIGRGLASTLECNFPGRLSKLYVLDLPASWLWLLQLVQRILHPVTRQKLVLCSSDSPSVPSTFTPITPRRMRPQRQTVSFAASELVQRGAGLTSHSCPGAMPEDSVPHWAVTPSSVNGGDRVSRCDCFASSECPSAPGTFASVIQCRTGPLHPAGIPARFSHFFCALPEKMAKVAGCARRKSCKYGGNPDI
jgi:hypothetical protein